MTFTQQVFPRQLSTGPVIDTNADERFLRKLDQHGLQLIFEKSFGCRLSNGRAMMISSVQPPRQRQARQIAVAPRG